VKKQAGERSGHNRRALWVRSVIVLLGVALMCGASALVLFDEVQSALASTVNGWQTSGAMTFYDYTGGKIGIGTKSPRSALNITTGGMAIGIGSGVSTTDGARNSLQLLTDTAYGGTFDNHSGALVYTTMPGGWGTAQLDVRISNGWGTYFSDDALTVGYDNSSFRGNLGVGTTSPGSYRLVVKEAVSGAQRGIRLVNATGTKSLQAWVGTGGAVLDAEGTTNLHLRTAGLDRLYH